MAPLDALMNKRAFLLRFTIAVQISELHTFDITNLLQMTRRSSTFVTLNQMPDQASLIYMVQAFF